MAVLKGVLLGENRQKGMRSCAQHKKINPGVNEKYPTWPLAQCSTGLKIHVRMNREGRRGTHGTIIGVFLDQIKAKLTYFQPSVVLQHSQKMSATACSPVSNTLSSAGPQPMFTLCKDDVSSKIETTYKQTGKKQKHKGNR